MKIDRRTMLALGLTATMSAAENGVHAAASSEPAVKPPGYVPPSQNIPLWPGQPPGGPRRAANRVGMARGATPGLVDSIDQPSLGLYRPTRPDGSAVIICPGGGYAVLAVVGEGSTPAMRLNADGVTVFVLRYRLPGEGWEHPANVPLQDLQRAMRIVRSRAREFNIDADRVGVIGFSAGGHLAATLATRHAERTYADIDAADQLAAKPAFAALIYPVISLTAPYGFTDAVPLLIGPNATAESIAARSVEKLVTADTAPCFLVHGMDDELVAADNSVLMMQALRAQKVRCEAHFFQHGKHGFGVGVAGDNTAEWPRLCVRWMQSVAKHVSAPVAAPAAQAATVPATPNVPSAGSQGSSSVSPQNTTPAATPAKPDCNKPVTPGAAPSLRDYLRCRRGDTDNQ